MVINKFSLVIIFLQIFIFISNLFPQIKEFFPETDLICLRSGLSHVIFTLKEDETTIADSIIIRSAGEISEMYDNETLTKIEKSGFVVIDSQNQFDYTVICEVDGLIGVTVPFDSIFNHEDHFGFTEFHFKLIVERNGLFIDSLSQLFSSICILDITNKNDKIKNDYINIQNNNDWLKINYRLNSNGPVCISLYNCNGRKIKEVWDTFDKKGVYYLNIEQNYASGHYFVKLNTLYKNFICKVFLLK